MLRSILALVYITNHQYFFPTSTLSYQKVIWSNHIVRIVFNFQQTWLSRWLVFHKSLGRRCQRLELGLYFIDQIFMNETIGCKLCGLRNFSRGPLDHLWTPLNIQFLSSWIIFSCISQSVQFSLASFFYSLYLCRICKNTIFKLKLLAWIS